jgi:hypothetical protein
VSVLLMAVDSASDTNIDTLTCMTERARHALDDDDTLDALTFSSLGRELVRVASEVCVTELPRDSLPSSPPTNPTHSWGIILANGASSSDDAITYAPFVDGSLRVPDGPTLALLADGVASASTLTFAYKGPGDRAPASLAPSSDLGAFFDSEYQESGRLWLSMQHEQGEARGTVLRGLLWLLSEMRHGLRGHVLDLAGLPVPDATLTVVELPQPVRTGSDGWFFRPLAPGEYSVIVTAPGFRTWTARLTAAASADQVVNVTLRRTTDPDYPPPSTTTASATTASSGGTGTESTASPHVSASANLRPVDVHAGAIAAGSLSACVCACGSTAAAIVTARRRRAGLPAVPWRMRPAERRRRPKYAVA